jgi:hypothetical protein
MTKKELMELIKPFDNDAIILIQNDYGEHYPVLADSVENVNFSKDEHQYTESNVFPKGWGAKELEIPEDELDLIDAIIIRPFVDLE